ncbi:MAG: TonB-dependent receptor [Ignavibacteriales bacterium]|nr:TonB-dependent receptor [Ignavibacteriales bacterium]
MTIRYIAASIFIILFCTNKYFSQQSDSIKIYQYNEIVITADKFESPLFSSTSTTTKINSKILSKLPINSNIEIFKYIPGFNITSTSGNYLSPILSLRGFNGGGEAEYISVFVDNIQINDVETGLVDWYLLANNYTNNIELLLGGSSSLYGDFAMGGVIDIRTFDDEINKTKFSQASGSYKTLKFNFNSSYNFSGIQMNLFGNYLTNDGFREHSKIKAISFGGNLLYNLNNNSTIRFTTVNNFNNEEIPGALSQNSVVKNSSSLPFFKFDENDINKIRFNIGYDYIITNQNKLLFDLTYINKNSSNIRTFTNNTPIIDINTFQPIGVYDTTLYGDTKSSEIKSNVLNGKAHFYSDLKMLKTKAIFGVDYLVSYYDNITNDIFNGFEIDYADMKNSVRNKIVDGSGNRKKFAAYLNMKSEIFNNLFMNVGLRYDYLVDNYSGTLPDTAINVTNDAISPKFGLSYNYYSSKSYNGRIYGNINKSFKAPTVEQLLDLKKLNFGIFIPISQTDFVFQKIKAAPFGNLLLKPQESTNFEFGTNQQLILSEQIQVDLSGTVYYSKIKNEIDFDLKSFKYENIANSKHFGSEFGINASVNKFNTFANFTLTQAESLEDEKKGLQLKGIPKNIYSFGFSYLFDFGINLSIAANSSNGGYLDDFNKNKMPDFITWDSKIGYSYQSFNLNLYVNNLFNKEYYTMGYTLENENYYYPMAQRNFLIEISTQF